MRDWRIAYKRNFLETLINEKKRKRGDLDCLRQDKLNRAIKIRMKSQSMGALDAINSLIKDVRDGNIDLYFK